MKKMKNDDVLFVRNEKEVNALLCRVLSYAFLAFPIMLLINLAGIFKFSKMTIIMLCTLGTFCTLSPLILSKVIKRQGIIKYYALLCIVVLVSVLGTQYYVGIYITLIIAPLISCLYFDKSLTVRMVGFSYIGFLVSYYFRCVETRDRLYPLETVWETYIPLVVGFTLEFLIALMFLYTIAKRSHYFLVDQKRMINELSKVQLRSQMAMAATKDIFFEYDIVEDRYSGNGSIKTWENKEIVIEHFMEYIDSLGWKDDSCPNVLKKFSGTQIEDGEHFSGTFCFDLEDENAKEYLSWVFFEIAIMKDKDGMPVTILGKLRDVTQEKLEERKLEEAKKLDALSGMYTYASLRKIVKETEIATKDKTHQIMIIHVKNYRDIANCYGNVYRDFVLMNVSEAIKSAVMDDSVIPCRLSEDVFLIYIEDCDRIDSRNLRQCLNEQLRDIYVGEKAVKELEFDFGYYLGEESIDELFTVALHYVNTNLLKNSQISDEQPQEQSNSAPMTISAHTFQEISSGKRREVVEQFINNISTLIVGTKDFRSSVQMALARVGKFFALDGVRIYQLGNKASASVAIFSWYISNSVHNDCDVILFEKEVRDFFVENFGRSRVVDNSTGAFRDFFGQFGENPLLIPGYSSLMCPISADGECRALIVYDVNQDAYDWEDEKKEYLLEISGILGNHVLMSMGNYLVREKESFLYNISNELRTSMNQLVGLTELVKKKSAAGENLNQYVENMEENTTEMTHTIENVIDLLKTETTDIRQENEIFSMEDMLSDLEQDVYEMANNKKISFFMERRFQKNLLRGDVRYMRRIFELLIHNAIEYTGAEGNIRVIVEEKELDGQFITLCISIEDDGRGILEEEIDDIFHVISDMRKEELNAERRTGFDLAVCYQIVRSMGGKLEAKQKESGGVIFCCDLQMEIPPKESVVEFYAKHSSNTEEEYDVQGRHILFCDTNWRNIKIQKELLELRGAHVTIAKSAIEAVRAFEESRIGGYDFILMTVNMPGMNGFAASRAIREMQREDAKRVPIIAVSTSIFVEDKQAALAAGMNMQLVKPMGMHRMLVEIKEVMKKGL